MAQGWVSLAGLGAGPAPTAGVPLMWRWAAGQRKPELPSAAHLINATQFSVQPRRCAGLWARGGAPALQTERLA